MDCCSGPEDDDSNFDRVTQMLPECFVSVKLENSEDCCEKLTVPTVSQTAGVIPYNPSAQFYTTTNLNASIMQNLQQHSVTSGRGGPPAHCFHHHRGSGMPELPPWLSHCYTAQMNPECSQTSYLAQDGALAQQGERLLKGGGRCDSANVSSGIGGLTNGDICDSNTFLNYVLNQQRSGSIFLFDSTRSAHASEELPESAASLNGHAHINVESTHHNCNQEINAVSIQKHTQSVVINSDTVASLSNRDSTDTSNANHKVMHSPCSVSASDNRPDSNDSSTNTASKYSQTVPYISLHQDAKTNTGDRDNDSDSSSHSPKNKNCTLNHCSKCVSERNMHCCSILSNQAIRNSDDVVKAVGNVCVKCNFISHSGLHYPCSCCSRNCTIAKHRVDANISSNLDSVGSAHLEHSCHNLCTNCTVSNRVIDHSLKSENIVSHCFNSLNKLTIQRGSIHHCKAMNDCGSMCVKNNRRMHYIDVDRPFTCEICFKNYPSSTALMNHTRYHRGERPYQCEICNKAFATNSHLVTHRRVHTGERPFQCQLCRRSFADRSAFVKHERTHGPNGTIIKRYKCEECGNAFVDSCGLKKHIRIHTGERPYRCSVCEKTFSTSSTFVAHKRIHSGERPYKCEQCSKMFITKSHLLTHRRTHTGEKPFTCQVCSRAFADGSSFRRHERLHTGENRHTCDVCGKGFPFDTSLAKHKQSHIPGSATYVYMV